MNEIARSVTITVESNNEVFNSKDDWGMYIQNFDCIGEPIQQTSYVTIPGSNVQVDLSESLNGYPVYISREINIQLAGKRAKYGWGDIFSSIRNKIQGRICQFSFSDDEQYYWRGRANVIDTYSEVNIGRLTISIPQAEPYKYSKQSSTERWLWDTFSFENGIIADESSYSVDGTMSIIIPNGYMPVVPDFLVENSAQGIEVRFNDVRKKFKNGLGRDPRIVVGGDNDVVLTFTGKGNIDVIFRRGSL